MNALKCGVRVGSGWRDGTCGRCVCVAGSGHGKARSKVKGRCLNGGKRRGLGLIWEVTDHRIDCSFSPWDSEGAI